MTELDHITAVLKSTFALRLIEQGSDEREIETARAVWRATVDAALAHCQVLEDEMSTS